MITVMAQAAVPTARAISWRPLAIVAALLLGAGFLAGTGDRTASTLLAVASAALASVVVSVLHDRAAPLMAALPVSTVRRRLLRLVLVAPPVLLVWFVLADVVSSTGPAGSVGPLLALAAAGVAMGTWAPARVGVMVGAVVPAAWFTLGSVVEDGPVGDLAVLWQTESWSVLALSVLAVALSWRQR